MTSATPILRSDALLRWHEFFAAHPQLDFRLPELSQVPIVVDASGALADLRSIARRKNPSEVRSALEEGVSAGTIIAFAPPWLRTEVESKLPLMAARGELSLETLRRVWARYQLILHFYEPSIGKEPHSIDPKDVPYREVARELGGLAVYGRDRHLAAMGAHLVGVREMILLRDFARAASPALALKIIGTLGLFVAGAPVVAGVRAGARLIARMPAVVQIGLAVAALIAVLHPKSRAFLAKAAASPRLEPIKQILARYLDELCTSQAAATDRWLAVSSSLPDRRRQPLIAHARAVCAGARGALSEQAIESAVKRAGYVSRSRSFRPYLKRVLRTDTRFIETQRGWWTLAGSVSR